MAISMYTMESDFLSQVKTFVINLQLTSTVCTTYYIKIVFTNTVNFYVFHIICVP
jgi:hypothetical protein